MSYVIDSCVWISLILKTDINHTTANEWFSNLPTNIQLISPSLVLVEVAATLSRANFNQIFIDDVIDLIREQTTLAPSFEEYLPSCLEACTKCRIKGADAIFLGTAHFLELKLVTFDKELAKKSYSWKEVKVILL